MVAVAFVACAAVGLASLLPSELVADEMNERIDEVQPTPYARVPSSAQPVDERITFGELEGLAEQYPPTGNFYFVTVTEPSQTILSWLVGRDEPAIEFLTEEEKFGFQTPQQRRVFGLESMRTSEQVAQYVALKAVGYDVTIVPGDVLISEMVCLVANDEGTECLESSPSDEVLDPGDRLLEVDGVPLNNVDDLSAALADKEPGDTVEIKLERPDVGELTVTVELTSASDEPDRTIVGFLPFDTRAGRAAVRARHRHRPHRRAVGRAGVHADADRRVDARRAHRRPEHRHHGDDRARRHASGRSAVSARRHRRSPRPGSTCSSCLRHKARTTSRKREKPGATDCASSRSPPSTRHWRRSRSWVVRRSTPFRLPPTNSPECLRWAHGRLDLATRPDVARVRRRGEVLHRPSGV